MKRLLTLCATTVLGASVLLTATAQAETAPKIIGYDIFNTTSSGFGGWLHYYEGGSITSSAGGLMDYKGGTTGTLSDGIFGVSTSETQLFSINNNTSITIYLDKSYLIDNVSLFSGPSHNRISGNITGADFETTSGGLDSLNSLTFSQVDKQFTLSNAPSFQSEVSQFTISNIRTGLGEFSDYYSISEIKVLTHPITDTQLNSTMISNAQVSAVPEPSTYALMLGGLGLIGFMARRKLS